MDAVIGVSVTPSTVGMVLVEGDSAADFEAVNLDLELFDVAGLDLSRARAARKEIVATVARAENVAADNGRRLRSIGVTWSDGADMQAAELVGDLNEAGFDNVVDVRFRQATDALANSIADMAGFATTVVCVFEPEGALALTVDRRDGVVDTARSRAIGSVRGLVGWLERLLAASGRVPDALVVVGSAVDLGPIHVPRQGRSAAVAVDQSAVGARGDAPGRGRDVRRLAVSGHKSADVAA